DPEQSKAAEQILEELTRRGIDTLLDDRNDRPGVKFKDAELIGIPVRVTIGKKLAQGEVELFGRRKRESRTVPVAEAVSQALEMLEEI
ncbi:MAG: His/Gly/Thr/Pro-type tRNA ligase C-terminal domain-containing protein, partial [Acidobacteriota bacterium]